MPPEIVNLPDGLTEEDFQPWLQAHPDKTLGDAVSQYLRRNAADEGRPLHQVIVEAFRGVVNAPFKALPPAGSWGGNFSPSEAPPPPGAVPGSPGFGAPPWAVPFAGVDPTVSPMIPRTPVGAVLTAAAGPASRVGAGGLSSILARMGIMGGAGAGAGVVSGEGAVSGGAQGILSQGLGEVVRGVTTTIPDVWRRHMGTLTSRTEWARQDASDLVTKGMPQDVPVFIRAFPNAKTPAEVLTRLVGSSAPGSRKSLGKMYLSEAVQESETAAIGVLGGPQAKVYAPTLQFALATKDELKTMGQAVLQSPQTTMTAEAAFEGLKVVTENAIKAKGTLASHALWEIVEKSRQEVLARVSQQAPAVAERYLSDLGMYGRGLTFLNAVQKSGALRAGPGAGTEPTFDGQVFLNYLDRLGAHGLTNSAQALLRGAPPGSREAFTTLPRFRVYKAGESTTAMVPPFRFKVRGGWDQPLYAPREPGMAPAISTIVGANATSGYVAE